MNIKILAPIFIVCIFSIMVGAGTLAVFSDTETTSGNSFTASAGTFDLTVDRMDGASVDTKVTLENMAPGDNATIGPIELRNSGSVCQDEALLKFANIVDSEDGINDPESKAPINAYDISNMIWVGVWYDENSDQTEDDGEVIYRTDLKNKTLRQLNGIEIELGDLMEGETSDLYLNFYLDEDTGNEYQGDYTTFDIVFIMDQDNDGDDCNDEHNHEHTHTNTGVTHTHVHDHDHAYGEGSGDANGNGNAHEHSDWS